MKIEKGTVRAPEIGRIWFNSPPLTMRGLRGCAILIDFWDYTCVNCIRTLPYVKEWHARYQDKGLTVIGVHTPEFLFARYESNVERGIEEFGLTYPIVVDSNQELWEAFANRYWPSKYLIDGQGYLGYAHFGAYRETEEAIQELLLEIEPKAALPPLLEPLRDSDHPGAVCYQPSPELYLGHQRGRIGNDSGFQEDQPAEYSHSGEMKDGHFYAQGRWTATGDHLESAGEDGDEARISIRYSAAGVNLVMASFNPEPREVELRQDGRALAASIATPDVHFRDGRSFIRVVRPRMYSLVDNKNFGTHTLELITRQRDVALFAFTFATCVDAAFSKSEG